MLQPSLICYGDEENVHMNIVIITIIVFVVIILILELSVRKNSKKFARCYEKEFKNQEGIYPFYDADEKIRSLSGLEECIVKYIRDNIESF